MNQFHSFLLPVEKCQLCHRAKQQFTCNVCILTGNFIHSKFHDKENANLSFINKQKRLHVVRSVTNDYQKRLEERLEKENQHSQKLNHLIILRSKIDTLKLALQEGKDQNEKEKSENIKFSNELDQKQRFIQRLYSKTERLSAHIRDKQMKIERYKRKLRSYREDLKQVRIRHMNALVNHIFPIREEIVFPTLGTSPRGTHSHVADIGSDVVSESLSTSPETDLEEATRTIHVGGKWISLTSEETQHTIIDVGMPSSGDFIKYFVWLKSYRSEPRSTESNIILHHNEILSIPAALIYSAQLTDVLAYFLGVNLPYRIEHINFGLLQVSRKKLMRTINKLAENVIYLCCSQGVDKSQLEPNAILGNLNLCLTTQSEQLGRTMPFETMEFRPTECPFDSDSSAEELNFDIDTDSVDGNTEEWDRLPDIPDSDLNISSPSFDTSRDRSLSSSASGLVTSAAASVASALWSWKR